jgi:ABC-type spermidine/putrescine transport system permease subunit I
MSEITNQLEAAVKYTGARTPIAAILVLFYLPLVAVVIFSFWDRSGLWMEPAFNLDAYLSIEPLLDQLLKSLVLGLIAGLLSVILAFPVAYYATYKLQDFHRLVLLSILAIPFFVSPFIRVTMLIPLIGDNGIINEMLLSIGIIDQPITLLFTDVGILIGALVTYTPIVIFTGWLSMSMIDREFIDAANDLRAGPFTAIRTIVIPLAMPGLSIGALFVIASTMGSTVFPVVLGGPSSTSVGLLVERSFGQLNVPRASAIMVVSSFIYLIGLVLAAQKLKLDELFDRFQ